MIGVACVQPGRLPEITTLELQEFRVCIGQIVAADVVRQLAAGKDFLFSDLGETELRGFEDPVKLWELRWQESNR